MSESNRRLVWVETCPRCDGRRGMGMKWVCPECNSAGELRTELTDAEREAIARVAGREEPAADKANRKVDRVKRLEDSGYRVYDGAFGLFGFKVDGYGMTVAIDADEVGPVVSFGLYPPAAVELAKAVGNRFGATVMGREDDAEKVTVDYLLSIGFKNLDPDDAIMDNGDLQVVIFPDIAYWEVWDGQNQQKMLPRRLWPKTRGDLRRLAAALGVELREDRG